MRLIYILVSCIWNAFQEIIETKSTETQTQELPQSHSYLRPMQINEEIPWTSTICEYQKARTISEGRGLYFCKSLQRTFDFHVNISIRWERNPPYSQFKVHYADLSMCTYTYEQLLSIHTHTQKCHTNVSSHERNIQIIPLFSCRVPQVIRDCSMVTDLSVLAFIWLVTEFSINVQIPVLLEFIFIEPPRTRVKS